MNKEAILKNGALDEELAEKGYVVVPFLSAETVQDLKAFFYQEQPHDIPGFYASAHSMDLDFRGRMNQKIKNSFESAIESYFQNCEALGGSFVVKTNKQKERLHPHQDWNIVDENKYRSFNIWVPLVDLNQQNGAIRVLEKSHLWGANFRGPNIPDDRQEQLEKIWEDMNTLHMKAGEALIYDHRLYHASYPNLTEEYRLACVFGIKPKDAQMYYYFGNNGKIEQYKSSVDFFMKGDIQKGPEILEKIAVFNPPKQTRSSNFFDKIVGLFSRK
ncbi:MAG: phytanoyl-CoA dioxygenase family protein [Bacteroidetes bacterium]|nr:phytanoyl-CoA dioxygenase family protein [Bacteroidota bacterium]